MMRHKILAFSTLALAALLWPAATSSAGHGGGGGGHGGGGHGGGGHGGGGHGGGGYHGGYGDHHGGYGGHHGGYGDHHGGYGGHHGGYGYYPGIGIGGYGYGGYGYGGLGGYGGYGGYGAYSAGYGNVGVASAPAALLPNLAVIDPAAQGLAPRPEGNPAQPQLNNSARVHIFVPPDAKVWVGGEATTPIGGEREFSSTELTPGKVYFYRVKAQWMKDGKMVEQTQKVRVRANETSNVTFGE